MITRYERQKVNMPLFSNGSEMMSWVAANCDQCWKHSKYKEATDTYQPFYCSIDKDIQMQSAGLDNPVSVKSHDTCQTAVCPYKELSRKKIQKHRPVKDQTELCF